MTINTEHRSDSESEKASPAQVALPGRGGLLRIWKALGHSLRGIRHGASSEAAIKQELALAVVGLPLSFVLASTVFEWIVLIGVVAMMLSAEFLNTAVERLCNHVTPTRHDAIKNIKDLASAGVFFIQMLALAVWIAFALRAVGVLG